MVAQDNASSLLKGWVKTAQEHFSVYKILQKGEADSKILFRQKYNALCQALEVALKAFLISNGHTVQEVKKIGHDLVKLLETAYTEHELMISPKVFEMIKIINPAYKSRKFLYFEEEYILPADIEPLESITHLLISKITFHASGRSPLQKARVLKKKKAVMTSDNSEGISDYGDSDKQPQPSFEELYKTLVRILLEGTEEDQKKVWENINSNEGAWPWLRVKLIGDAWGAADAKAREEFLLIALERHIKEGNAKPLEDVFTDSETGIQYKQYRYKNGLLTRIPIATEGMDKYAYDKAANKKFLGDYIEMTSTEGVTLIPLDTEEKVKDYNAGDYFRKHHFPSKAQDSQNETVKKKRKKDIKSKTE